MLLNNETVRRALEEIKALDGTTTRETLALCQIPAPSHQEREKAEAVERLFREIGLLDVHMDEVGNVLGRWPGTGGGPTVMLAAHTDTVFPLGTDVTVRREGDRYYCPGINDDTHAVAEIMAVAKAMVRHDLRAKGDLIFCANVCEEGRGGREGGIHTTEEWFEPVEAWLGPQRDLLLLLLLAGLEGVTEPVIQKKR